MIRRLALLAALAPLPALADIESVDSPHPVARTADALAAAAEARGATIVARVDHAAAAAGIGATLPEAQLLILGNPALGTPVMQEDIRAGLMLPLRVLVHADADGQTRITWQEPDEMFDDLDVDDDGPAVEAIEDALEALAAEAVR